MLSTQAGEERMPRTELDQRSGSASTWARCVLLTGVLVGVADYAIGFGIFVALFGRPLLGVFQAPAAGVLGLAAFRGGLRTAALGTLLHFVIAVVWALVFAFVYRRWPTLRRTVARASGLVFASAAAGAIVWLVDRKSVV